jgi:hypothetical protein
MGTNVQPEMAGPCTTWGIDLQKARYYVYAGQIGETCPSPARVCRSGAGKQNPVNRINQRRTLLARGKKLKKMLKYQWNGISDIGVQTGIRLTGYDRG